MLLDDYKLEGQITLWLKRSMTVGFWIGYSTGFAMSGSIMFIIYHLIGG